jgi:nucleoside-diphosphate-sugar epimerase
MKRVLVTGGAGFVGRQTLGELHARGYEVHAADRRSLAAEPAIWHELDLLDARAVSELVATLRPTHLLHLAWCTAHGKFWSAPENLDWVAAGIALVNAATAAGIQRIVAAGSCAEYDWSHGYCVEDLTPTEPATLYGKAKNAFAELLLARAQQLGLGAAWGRVFLAYGPFEHPERLVPSVARALLCGERAACTHGEQLRDVLHVRDVARAFVHLLDGEGAGTFNVCSGTPISVRAVVERIAAEVGRPELLALGALPARPDDPPLLVGSPVRLNALGFRPSVPLDVGLSEAVAWWKQREQERLEV